MCLLQPRVPECSGSVREAPGANVPVVDQRPARHAGKLLSDAFQTLKLRLYDVSSSLDMEDTMSDNSDETAHSKSCHSSGWIL